MKKRKISNLLEIQLADLRQSRNRVEGFLSNYLLNFSEFAKPMHALLPAKQNANKIRIAALQYLSSIVGCWETYFRDTFAYISSIDTEVRNNAIAAAQLSVREVSDIKLRYEINEYLSKCANFQILKEAKQLFYPVFAADLFEYAAKSCATIYSARRNAAGEFSLEAVFPDYMEVIGSSIELRHKITHDANFARSAPLELTFFQKAEAVFLIFPQVISRLLSEKYNIPRIVMNVRGSDYEYLFTIEDLITDDWTVVDDDNQSDGSLKFQDDK